MSYNLITIPDGFDTKKSYIKWMGTAEVDNGLGATGATFHRQVPPLTGKVKEVVQPHSNGDTVMSGRRSLIKGYFWRCAGRGCDHVFGLLLRRIGSAGPDVVR